jgi:hypothetical protein
MTRSSLPGEPRGEASRGAGTEPAGDANGRASAVAVVDAFERAVNDGDADQVIALAARDVEVGGPRGRGHGHELLREWVERAGIQLSTSRIFERGGVIVAEQAAHWGPPEEAGPETHTIATEFVVRGGRIAAVVRHDDLESALDAAGLRLDDEVRGIDRPGRA